MAELTEDQLLDLIEENDGPQGLNLSGQNLRDFQLGQEAVLRKLQERGYTSLEPAQFLQRWQENPSWNKMQEKGYVQGDCPPWLSTDILDTLGLNLSGANLSSDASGQRAILIHAELQRAILIGANLQHADLWKANLQHARLDEAHLQHANLYEVNLQHADLSEADLQHARLTGADLQQADLLRAKLQQADLSRAKLQHADLSEADLQHAILSGADLQHALLIMAKLQDADLSRAKLQHARLSMVEGLEKARLEDVDWDQGYSIGDEDEKSYRGAEAVYYRLKQYYNSSGQYDHAGEFHFREMECRRKGVQKLGDRFWLWAFRLSCGYGERPLWTLGWLGFFLLVPFLLYWLISPLSGWQALYYSFASLVAFINPLEVEISPWLGTVALGQAYAGYFLLALFLVVFVVRMGHR